MTPIIVPAVLIVGALVFALAAGGVMSAQRAETLDEKCLTRIYGLDRLPIADIVVEVFGPDASVALARAMVAIAHNECGGNSSPPVIGDTNSSGGPSIGPLQVWRQTAIDLGLVPSGESQDTYRQRAYDEMWCLRAGVKVFKDKLHSAGGDIALAIRKYNGSGSAAEAYRDRALSFLASTFGYNWENG